MTTEPRITLQTPLRGVAVIREKVAAALAALGVKNIGQLVAYLPTRHDRHEAETTIAAIQPGTIITTRGEVTATRSSSPRGGRKPRFEAVLHDGTARLDLVWFNAPYMRRTVHPGMRLRVHGEVRPFGGGVQLANPKYFIIEEGKEEPIAEEGRMRTVYPASERISSDVIAATIGAVLPDALSLIDDHLAPEYRAKRSLPELRDAYRMIHQPSSGEEAREGRRRLAYDELLLMQLGVQMKRSHLRRMLRSPALRWSKAIDEHIRARFPFTLTPDQNKVIAEVVRDVTRDTPTNRLIQGDVGSGKTVAALYAMLLAVASKHQAALMAPTELLSEQHFASISAMLDGSKVRVRLLTGALNTKDRVQLFGDLERGEVDILIGTHALISQHVKFHSLALAVIDEQHRFGVHQRAALRTKGSAGVESKSSGAAAIADTAPITPHVLVMTATPIPRTLALTLFGDLDVSTIRSLPVGRKPVRTRVVASDRLDEVYAFVRRRVDAGDQVFIVVPTIEGDSSDGENASGLGGVETVMTRLTSSGGALEGVPVAAMHGRVPAAERDGIMRAFRDGRYRVLVATTVIEVGVDVPAATVMVIEHAERFGLSQLHQLRGRVGRGTKPAVCLLVGDPVTDDAAKRLEVIRRVSDGFMLAERDFEIRGPGEVFGLRQSGVAPFKVADLMNDRDLLRLASRDAEEWIARSPTLSAADEVLVKRRLLKAYGPWIGIGDVG